MRGAMNISEFVGKTFVQIIGMEPRSVEVRFITDEGATYLMRHVQDCCECVDLDDIVGDPADLIGVPILSASGEDSGDAPKKDEWDESYTWTFYRLTTIKGTATLKWYGVSRGYYSEEVEIDEVRA